MGCASTLLDHAAAIANLTLRGDERLDTAGRVGYTLDKTHAATHPHAPSLRGGRRVTPEVSCSAHPLYIGKP
jgi:hypothetical protein